MCRPLAVSDSENSSFFPPSVHVSDELFGSIGCGSPPSTGTCHVSHPDDCTVPYAICEPSGEKEGLIFSVASCVSCAGSPSGSSFTYTCPGPKNELSPRMNASIRPSGESAGYTAESVKNVNCSQPLLGAGISRVARNTAHPAAPTATASTAPAAYA